MKLYLTKKEVDSLKRKPKIGLALGAGGAKGLAHVSILKILQKIYLN